jgi:hypothetical protein
MTPPIRSPLARWPTPSRAGGRSWPQLSRTLSSFSVTARVLVDHDDPAALVTALRNVLRQPRLAGSMAAEARRLAPDMAWPVVADAYLRLAQRLIAQRPSVV